ncbi:MAG: DUF3619 family protein [Betaproteobacteria bacterium]
MKFHSSNAGRSTVEAEALQTRFGLEVAARLGEAAEMVAPDVAERLRFARERALERCRAVRAEAPAQAVHPLGQAGGAAVLGLVGRFAAPWWLKLAGALPLFALVAGLLLIQESNRQAQIRAAAEVDAALLSDDLPPSAYSDPGFVEFLKTDDGN